MARRTNQNNGNENIDVKVVSFGLNEAGAELIKSIENYNTIIGTGSKGIEDNIPALLGNICLNPVEETILNFNLKENPKDEKHLALKLDRDNRVLTLPIVEEFKKATALIPEGYKLRSKEINKKINDKYTKFTFLPYNLNYFYGMDLSDTGTYPSSVLAFVFSPLDDAETGEKLFESKFISVTYNQYNKKYELHKWRIVYTLVKAKIEVEKKLNKFIDNML